MHDDEYWKAEAAKHRRAIEASRRERDEARAETARLRAADQLKQTLRKLGVRDTTIDASGVLERLDMSSIGVDEDGMPYQRDINDLAHKLVHDKRSNLNTDYVFEERRRARGGAGASAEPAFSRKTDYRSLDAEGRAKFDAWLNAENQRRVDENMERPRFKLSDEEFEAIDKQLFPNDPKRQWEADLRRRADKF